MLFGEAMSMLPVSKDWRERRVERNTRLVLRQRPKGEPSSGLVCDQAQELGMSGPGSGEG